MGGQVGAARAGDGGEISGARCGSQGAIEVQKLLPILGVGSTAMLINARISGDGFCGCPMAEAERLEVLGSAICNQATAPGIFAVGFLSSFLGFDFIALARLFS